MKKQLLINLVFVLIGWSNLTNAQITFQKGYGIVAGGMGNYCSTAGWGTIKQATDGYIIVGSGYSNSTANTGIWLIKINLNGDTLWTKHFVSPITNVFGNCVVSVNDGGYAAIFEGYGIGIIKTNSIGDTSWVKQFVATGNSHGCSAKQTSDNGYIIAGFDGSVHTAAILIKLDSNGTLLWQKKISLPPNSTSGYILIRDVIQTSDGGYVVAGAEYDYHNGVAIKTDSLGNVLWAKRYGTTADAGFENILSSVHELNNGDLIFGGIHNAQTMEHMWLIKTNKNGNLRWSRTFGGTIGDNGVTAIVTPDSGYVIAGSTGSFANNSRGYLVKADSSGNMEWSKFYSNSYFNSVENTLDGGLIASGFGTFGFYVVKTDAFGNCSCNATIPATIVDTPLVMVNNLIIDTSSYIVQHNYGMQVSSGLVVTNICTSVGTTENNLLNDIAISPNPFTSLTTITFSEQQKNTSLTVTDVLGNIVLQSTINSNQSTIDMSGYAKGVYFVRVMDASASSAQVKNVMNRKIILQ